ncbi:MAG: hypothetical protein IJ368_00295 [Oscillospiraceae bacterium]|nr:hypothetical protein [Oscillospiraceae bacterium]
MTLEDIISKKDSNALMQLDDNELDDLIMKLYYECYSKTDISELNEAQLNIYLCSFLEDCTQADTAYTFIEEGMGRYILRAAAAYDAVGAPETAALVREMAELIPEAVLDGEEPDDELMDKLMEFDEQISDYPDGIMSKLYREYARKHSAEIL